MISQTGTGGEKRELREEVTKAQSQRSRRRGRDGMKPKKKDSGFTEK